jgi:nucleotide-binding universal stress UspA family protein
MYKKMLVPLDGSLLAEVVLPYARQLAGRMDLDLTLLHVCHNRNSESQFMCQSYVDHSAELLQAESREVQRRTGAPEESKPVEITSKVIGGDPAEEILDFAAENDIDLILMASHGYSGIRRWVMGSVADKVLRKAPVPVWLVRSGNIEEIIHEQWLNRTILVPLDGSEFAESALPHVEALAGQRGDGQVKIVLMRVYEKPFVTADYPEPDWKEHVNRMVEQFRHESEKYLSEIQARLSRTGLDVSYEVLEGKAADVILSYADSHRPNIIVMTTHGNSLASRWEYGNVADKVLHGASGPIFLVRPAMS